MRKLRLTAELLALVDRVEADPGPDPDRVPMSDADYDALSADILAMFADGPLWLFAYGSLLWNPGFDFEDCHPARAHGWHRSFCMKLSRFRGSPENPGLMLALDRGGSCRGQIMKIAASARSEQLGRLLKREIPYRRLMKGYRKIGVQSRQGSIEVLTFYAGMRGDKFYSPHPIEEQAKLIARAAGHGGSAAAYLFQTVNKLEELGIHDSYIWRLQALVADEIRRMHQLP